MYTPGGRESEGNGEREIAIESNTEEREREKDGEAEGGREGERASVKLSDRANEKARADRWRAAIMRGLST